MKTICVLVALLACFSQTEGLKVLGIFPFGSSSHFAIGNSIVKALHKVGHEITVISPYPQKKPLANFRDIGTTDILEKHKKDQEEQKLNMFDIGNMPTISMIPFLYFMGADLVKSYLDHPGIQEFLKSGEKFDVCIIEVFNADALLVRSKNLYYHKI